MEFHPAPEEVGARISRWGHTGTHSMPETGVVEKGSAGPRKAGRYPFTGWEQLSGRPPSPSLRRGLPCCLQAFRTTHRPHRLGCGHRWEPAFGPWMLPRPALGFRVGWSGCS